MKKIALVVLCASVIASVSIADINVGWRAAGGFYTDAGATLPLLSPSGSVLAQLIYSASGAFGAATDVSADDYIDTSSDNQLLTSFVLSWNVPGATADSEWGDFNKSADIYAGYSAGFVYARIFQLETPTSGSWYYNSAMTAVSLYDPGAPAYQTCSVNRGGSGGDQLAPSAPNNFQVIPEPATMALLGLGGLLMAIRRRKV